MTTAGPTPISRACVRAYLHAISRLALECADKPELPDDFLGVVKLVPETVSDLRAAAGRMPLPRDRMQVYSGLDLLQLAVSCTSCGWIFRRRLSLGNEIQIYFHDAHVFLERLGFCLM